MTSNKYIEAESFKEKVKDLKYLWDIEHLIDEESASIATELDEIIGKGTMKEDKESIAFSKQYVIDHPDKAMDLFKKFMEGARNNEQ